MNKRDKIINEKQYKDLLDMNSKKYTNVIKCWKKTSKEHFLTMCQICYKLLHDYNMTFCTECVFRNNARADIFAFSGQLAIIIEVLKSETNERFELKKDYYPNGIPIIKVHTKDFKIDEFKV
jgi:hypothetical protein